MNKANRPGAVASSTRAGKRVRHERNPHTIATPAQPAFIVIFSDGVTVLVASRAKIAEVLHA